MSDFDPEDADAEFAEEPVSAPAAPRAEDSHWHELLSQVGHEVAAPLSTAMERIRALAATGRIDRQNLRALQQEVELARRAGIIGQQLARFAAGRIAQAHERLPLARLLRELVQQRSAVLQSRGLSVRPSLKEVEVLADASLLHGLCNALLDWAVEHAQAAIDLRITLKAWPVQAQLSCRFAWRTAQEALPPAADRLDSLNWRLLQHMAWAMGLLVDRDDAGVESIATLQFPRALRGEIDTASAPAPAHDSGLSTLSSRPLAGSQVLVILREDAQRQLLREAVGHMGLLLDFVDDVETARAYCADGLPHAVVYGSFDEDVPAQIDGLRAELRDQAPDLPFIELLEEGDGVELSHVAGQPVTRVGWGGLRGGLASALIFELSRSL